MSNSWEQKFYNPTILWMLRARNAKNRVIVPSNSSGKFQLEVKDFTTGFHKQLTKNSQGSLFGSISPDGKFVFFLDDRKGNETGHFVRVPFEGGKKTDITPGLPSYFSYEVSLSDLGDRLCFSASINEKNRVYLISFNKNLKPIQSKLLYESKNFILSSIISPDGLHTCISTKSSGTSDDTSEIFIFNNENGKIICHFKTSNSFIAQTFSQDSRKNLILGTSNTSGFYRPVFFDFLKKETQEIKDKEFQGNIFTLEWFEDKNQLVLGQEFETKHGLFVYDLGEKQAQVIGPTYGNFDFSFGSIPSLGDGSLFLRWQSLNNPPKIIKLEGSNYNEAIEINSPKNQGKSKMEFESIKFKSSDGELIQMLIVKASGKKGPSPFIIDIHGGPHTSVGDSFSPQIQIWLENGFNYCAINYRGSTGFGKDFERAIYGDPGTLEVEDIVAGRNWLIEKGLADPNKIILFGWSWGGYVTLLALGKYPNLWAGGIAGTPITDFFLQYKDEPAFFQALEREMFGGTPLQKPSAYKKSSPITYADNFTKPILIIYGENDVRCPPRQIVKFIKILRRKNKLTEVKKFSSGHAGEFSNTKIRVSNFKKALNFAKKIIKKTK